MLDRLWRFYSYLKLLTNKFRRFTFVITVIMATQDEISVDSIRFFWQQATEKLNSNWLKL